MPNKKILIMFFIALFLLGASFVNDYFRTKKEEQKEEEKVKEEMLLEETKTEENIKMLSDLESELYSIAERLFLMDEEVIALSEEEFFRIEKKIREAREDIANKLVGADLIYSNIEKITKDLEYFEKNTFNEEENNINIEDEQVPANN